MHVANNIKSQKKIWIVYGIIAIFLTVATYFTTKNYWLLVIYLLMFLPSQNYYLNKRIKEIDRMWALADELSISTAELSEMCDVGQHDLEATKKNEEGRFLPPNKKILLAIEKLEALKITAKADSI